MISQLTYMAFIIVGLLFIIGAWYLVIILCILLTAFYGAKILIFIKEAWNADTLSR